MIWFSTADQGDDSNKTESARYLAKEINDQASQGWEFVTQVPYTHVGNSIVTFLVLKK